jgi:hypothetical protein
MSSNHSEYLAQNSRPSISEQPRVVMQFYHSHAFPYLIERHQQEIMHRLKEVPKAVRQRELVPVLAPLGETNGDAAWQVFRTYLDGVERCIAEIVCAHSPSFWLHLHRRLRPMLAKVHDSKTDDTTVALVRRIAELAYSKHGNLDRTDDLGPIVGTRLDTFLDGAWYAATERSLGSKLKAKKHYQTIKWTKHVVMTDFRTSDLCDVFGVEGLCYEYWWATAVMRSIGKGSAVKWDAERSPPVVYKDTEVNPLCFEIYDQRNSEKGGFHTSLGTWIDDPEEPNQDGADHNDKINFTFLTPNPDYEEYPVWNKKRDPSAKGLAPRTSELEACHLQNLRTRMASWPIRSNKSTA